jgi:hypothetical protein
MAALAFPAEFNSGILKHTARSRRGGSMRSRQSFRSAGDEQATEDALGKLALPALDPGDLVGELRDQEARALVRAMPQEKRDR